MEHFIDIITDLLECRKMVLIINAKLFKYFNELPNYNIIFEQVIFVLHDLI